MNNIEIKPFLTPQNGGDDCNGHGTHCTGTAGGATFGIARGANLYSARVLNCFGSGIWDDLIEGRLT